MARQRARPRTLRVFLGVVLATQWLAACNIITGPNLAPGTQECVGVPFSKCQALLEKYRGGRPVSPTAFSIHCQVPECTEAAGSALIEITWSDGTTETASIVWDGP